MFRYTLLVMPYWVRFDSLNFGCEQQLSRRISNIDSTDKIQEHLQHFSKVSLSRKEAVGGDAVGDATPDAGDDANHAFNHAGGDCNHAGGDSPSGGQQRAA